MIRIGALPPTEEPVIVPLAKALGDALDAQQVAIVRAYLDETGASRPHECRWCPPGCPQCEPDDCECYAHQDWIDKTVDPNWPYVIPHDLPHKADGATKR